MESRQNRSLSVQGQVYKHSSLMNFAESIAYKCFEQRHSLGWLLGPMLANELSLLHYQSCELVMLKNRLSKAHPKLLELGIHVLVSQHGHGKITVGDSHEYGEPQEDL